MQKVRYRNMKDKLLQYKRPASGKPDTICRRNDSRHK